MTSLIPPLTPFIPPLTGLIYPLTGLRYPLTGLRYPLTGLEYLLTCDIARSKFVEDLRESVAEMDEMEALRIEGELEKQHVAARVSVSSDFRDSGITDLDPHGTPAR